MRGSRTRGPAAQYNRMTAAIRQAAAAEIGKHRRLLRTGRDGRITTTSTLLYLDGNRRSFEGRSCSGTQSSRRVDDQTVEILLTCASGNWTKIVRRRGAEPKELIIEITEQHSQGRRLEQRLLLEKQ